MMAEAIERRYSGSLSQKLPLPDLILVDGGKGQLGAALAVLEKLQLAHLPLAALAKRVDDVFVPGSSDPQNISRASSSLKLLQQLRDEAHRFSLGFHRHLRHKRTVASELENVAGIGPAKRTALTRFFGSLEGVRHASVDELILVRGITADLAQRIWEHFHTVKDAAAAALRERADGVGPEAEGEVAALDRHPPTPGSAVEGSICE